MTEIKISCEVCGSHQPLGIDPMVRDQTFPHQGIWGDLYCQTCKLVLKSIVVPEQGIYAFVKISDLEENK